MLFTYTARYREDGRTVFCTTSLRTTTPTDATGYTNAKNTCKTWSEAINAYMKNNKPTGVTVGDLEQLTYNTVESDESAYTTRHITLVLEYIGSLAIPRYTVIEGIYNASLLTDWYQNKLALLYGITSVDYPLFRARSLNVNIY